MYFGVQIPSPAFRNIPLEMNVLSANQIKSKRKKMKEEYFSIPSGAVVSGTQWGNCQNSYSHQKIPKDNDSNLPYKWSCYRRTMNSPATMNNCSTIYSTYFIFWHCLLIN